MIYRWPFLYQSLSRIRLGRGYLSRFQAVADLIFPGETVLELCCGDAYLYRKFLRGKNVSYRAIDFSGSFTRDARAEGVDIEMADITAVEWPPVDVVLMQASLYHFLPDRTDSVLARMKSAARRTAIVSEPIHNLTTSKVRAVAWLGRQLSRSASGEHPFRFDERSFNDLARRHGAVHLRIGCEALACFAGEAGEGHPQKYA